VFKSNILTINLNLICRDKPKILVHKIQDLYSYSTENTLHSHYKRYLEMLFFSKVHTKYKKTMYA